MSMSESNPKDVRSWSGPIEHMDEDERRALIDSMTAEERPRIAITDALHNNWFEIWYQPKIDLKRKCLAGAEALARIHHPQLGILLPGSFLPDVDEESIGELAQHALLATLCDWTMFEEAGFNLHLAINVPAGVLFRMPIVELVAEYRPKSPHWPGLIIEVTEDQIVRDIALANEVTAQLRGSGISIAIDDFGAGYSGLSLLTEFQPRIVKLDMLLIRDIDRNPVRLAIVRGVLSMCRELGILVIAEGVESVAEYRVLEGLGVALFQGFLFARPAFEELPAVHFPAGQ